MGLLEILQSYHPHPNQGRKWRNCLNQGLPKPFTVSEINKILKNQILSITELQKFRVLGEISNLSHAGNSHTYFKLKDKSSILNCAFFAGQKRNYRGKPLENGMQIEISGSINFYEPGSYPSVTVYSIEEMGKGDILYQIELLKQKLNQMGIFDESRKRPIPRFPRTIGIATALNGAAVQDIIKVVRTVSRNVNILLAPCLVQGDMAASSIISAIQSLNNPIYNVDVIIAGRGGGSSEDLMAFNQEDVVMAFYHSRVPIISAVGHEIDTVLSDYAADDSAPTPSIAAETVVSSLLNIHLNLTDLEERLINSLKIKIRTERDKFIKVANSRIFKEPDQILFDRYQIVDDILKNILLLGKNTITKKISGLQKYDNISIYIKSYIESTKSKFLIIQERIDNFSPLGTLKRGYSVVRNKNKNVIKSIHQVKVGDELEIILDEGKIKAEVKGKV
jgi:exodeoxyribonuclease VII large subunit